MEQMLKTPLLEFMEAHHFFMSETLSSKTGMYLCYVIMKNNNKGNGYKINLISVLKIFQGIPLFQDVADTLDDAVLPLKI